MKRSIARLMLVFTAAMALPSAANAITVAEFDKKTQEKRAEIVSGAVEKIIRFYEQKDPNGAKLACIKVLYTSTETYENMRGNELLIDELEKARKDNPESHHVEMLIFGIVSRECPTSPAASPTR